MQRLGFAAGMMGIAPIPAQFLPRAFEITVSAASIPAGGVVEQTFALEDINLGDLVFTNSPGLLQAGLTVLGSRVAGDGEIGITFANTTGAPIIPTPDTKFKVIAVKCS